MRVALLVTCLADALFPEVGVGTVRVLERLGCTVTFPPDQTCCGQAHANSGYRAEGVALARRTARVLEGHDAVVCPSGSCTAMIREGYANLARSAGDADLEAAAAALAPRVHELSEFLVDVLGVEDVGARFAHRVAYHPACHGLRTLRLGDRPLRLLRAVRGLELVDLDRATECCGFGGTFAVRNADVSMAMLTDKMRAVTSSGCEVLTAVDASCLMHVGGGLRRGRAGVRTMHLAEILAAGADA